MARKKANGAQEISTATPAQSSTDSIPSPPFPRPTPRPLSLAPLPGTRDVVKVNNFNVTELKNACDDAVKRYLSRPELFKQIHQHTDVPASPGVAKRVCRGYMLLTFAQTLYSYFCRGQHCLCRQAKTFSKRIITERITLSSRTLPSASIPPQYALALTYVRSTSANKSLLAKGKTQAEAPYSRFFDAEGTMDADAFERWVGELVEDGMGGREKAT
ncbi:hypothetical protein B0H14DRAFT_3117054 [Mycena olivaceomarginata]|nr:hypothetical protein B0H14DRAFT_3117054 [Mycena olivaceomarginata]